jgi:DNA-binding LacI/PurR family transcriptional regulator
MDVARAAEVSRTTASAALGSTGRVSAGTRERVKAVAERLGYVANPAARHLKGGRKGAIALYVPDHLSGYAFYMEFAFGAVQVARSEGIALTLVAPGPDGAVTPLLAHVDAFLVVDPFAGTRSCGR